MSPTPPGGLRPTHLAGRLLTERRWAVDVAMLLHHTRDVALPFHEPLEPYDGALASPVVCLCLLECIVRRLPVCLSLSVGLSVSLSVCLFVYLTVYLFALSPFLSSGSLVCLSIKLPARQSLASLHFSILSNLLANVHAPSNQSTFPPGCFSHFL